MPCRAARNGGSGRPRALDVARDVAGEHVERNVAAIDHRLVEVAQVVPAAERRLRPPPQRDDLGAADLVAAGLPGPGAVAVDLALRVGARQTGRGDELGERLVARPALRVDAGVDDQPHRAPRQPHQIAEPACRIALVHPQLVGELLGIERPAFRIGVEGEDRADERQRLRVLALPDVAGNAFVIDEVGDRHAVVDRRIAEVDPHLAGHAAVDGARAAVGRGRAGFLGERHAPDLKVAAREAAEGAGKARADRVDTPLHVGDDLPASLVAVGKADAGALLEGDGALGDAALRQALAAQDHVHLRL